MVILTFTGLLYAENSEALCDVDDLSINCVACVCDPVPARVGGVRVSGCDGIATRPSPTCGCTRSELGGNAFCLVPQNPTITDEEFDEVFGCEYFIAGVNYDGTPLTYPVGITSALDNKEIMPTEKIKRPGLSFKLMSCIEYIINDVTSSHLRDLANRIQMFVISLIVLYIIFLGVRVMFQSVPNLQGELIFAVISISVVTFFTIGVGMEDYIRVLKDSQAVVAGILMDALAPDFGAAVGVADGAGVFHDAAGIVVPVDAAGVPITPPLCDYSIVWMQFDCIAANIFGAHTPDALDANQGDSGYGTNIIIAAYHSVENLFTLVKVIGGLLFSNQMGILFGFLVTILVAILILSMAQAMYVYISALLVVTFLAIVSPLFIPMMLFKQTQKYFDNWLKQLMIYLLQPILVVGYISFMLMVLGFVLDRECITTPAVEKDIAAGIAGSPAVTKECGLIHIYKDMRIDARDKLVTEEFLSAEKVVTPSAKQDPECVDALPSTGSSCVNARAISLKYDKIQKLEFVRELLLVVIVLSVMFGMLQEVMADAGRLVGAETGSAHTKNMFAGAVHAAVRASQKFAGKK